MSRTRRLTTTPTAGAMLLTITLTLFTSGAAADEWVTPQARTVTAPAGSWRVTVTPRKSDGDRNALASVTGPASTVEIALRNEWMPVGIVLLDDGTLLTFDDWHQMGYGPNVAVAYGPEGKVRWHHELAELIGQDKVDAAPHSVSSIWWRKEGPEWALTHDGKAIQLTLWDENKVAIDLADGTATVVVVDDVGEDVERIFARARALASAGDNAGAVPLFDKVLTRDPNRLEAYLELGRAQQALGALEAAQTTLERGVAVFASRSEVPGYNRANLNHALARIYRARGDLDAAEKTLRAALDFEPSYALPVLELADLLWSRGRKDDVDAVMAAFYERNKDAQSTVDMVVSDIGGFYARVGEHRKAIAYYERIYTQDRVTHQFAYESMATSLEAVGEVKRAIAIHAQLIAHYQALGPDAFAWYIERSNEALKRLGAK